MNSVLPHNPYAEALSLRLAAQEDLEKKLDELRNFKKEQSQPLRESFLKGKISLLQLMASLTHLADAILVAAHAMAVERLDPTFGTPSFKDNQGNILPGEYSIIGMGKLGGGELHFGSDLDVIFIYNQNGDTLGARPITNREYFAKLTQRIISYLTLHTSRGFAYHVDTELRPSGMAGALVTPMDSWKGYYQEMAQVWERQALLRARIIYASGDFAQEFEGLFQQLIFNKPFPKDLGHEIHHLRMRIERELAKESARRWNFKKGYGGLVDIEFLVQYLQLKLGNTEKEILTPNTLVALKRFSQKKILPAGKIELLESAYEFYRLLEFYLALNPEWNQGYLDPKGKSGKILGKDLNFKNQEDFIKKFAYYRDSVRKIYLETLHIEASP